MSERKGQGLPQDAITSSLSEVRSLLREESETARDPRIERRKSAAPERPESPSEGAELREVLMSAPSGAELEAERRARWAESGAAVTPSRRRGGVWWLGLGSVAVVGLVGLAAWALRGTPVDAEARESEAAPSSVAAPMTTASAPPSPPTSSPSTVAAPPSSAPPAASATPRSPKKPRPAKRNVDRQFDDVLDRL